MTEEKIVNAKDIYREGGSGAEWGTAQEIPLSSSAVGGGGEGGDRNYGGEAIDNNQLNHSVKD